MAKKSYGKTSTKSTRKTEDETIGTKTKPASNSASEMPRSAAEDLPGQQSRQTAGRTAGKAVGESGLMTYTVTAFVGMAAIAIVFIGFKKRKAILEWWNNLWVSTTPEKTVKVMRDAQVQHKAVSSKKTLGPANGVINLEEYRRYLYELQLVRPRTAFTPYRNPLSSEACKKYEAVLAKAEAAQAKTESAGGKPSPAKQNFFQSDGFEKMVETFHDKFAVYPFDQLGEAREHSASILSAIQDYLAQQGLKTRVESTGPACECLKTVYCPLEFEVMMIMEDEKVRVEGHPQLGYASLAPRSTWFGNGNSNFKERMMGSNISSKLTTSWFFAQLQNCIEDDPIDDLTLKVRANGAMTQIDVCDADGGVWYSMSIVPAYSVEGVVYGTKSLNDEEVMEPHLWSRSSPKNLERLLEKMDEMDNGCRKQCIRILMVLFQLDGYLGGTLFVLNTYHIKTALLHLIKDDPNLDWNVNKTAERCGDILGRLLAFIREGSMPNYFIPFINALNGFSSAMNVGLAKRLDLLHSSRECLQFLLGTR